MAKLLYIFNTKSECDSYFVDGIPSKALVIIKEISLPDGSVMTNSLLTTTNNIEVGKKEEVGESSLSYAYTSTVEVIVEKEENDTAYILSTYTLYGES